MLDIVERILAALIILALVSLLIVLASHSSGNGKAKPETPSPPKVEKPRASAKGTRDGSPGPVPAACGPGDRACGDRTPPRRVAARPLPCSTRGGDYDDRRCRADWYPDDVYAPPARRPCGPRYGRAEPCECEEQWRPYWARYRYAGGCDD